MKSYDMNGITNTYQRQINENLDRNIFWFFLENVISSFCHFVL